MVKFKDIDVNYDLIVNFDPINYQFKYDPPFQIFRNDFIRDLGSIVHDEIIKLQHYTTKEMTLSGKKILLINHPVRNYNLIFTFNSKTNEFNYKNKDNDEIAFIKVYEGIVCLPLNDCVYEDDITLIHNKILNQTKRLSQGTIGYFELYNNKIMDNVFITLKLINEYIDC